jgi:hypothetical protein
MVEYCKKVRFQSGEQEHISIILGMIIHEDAFEIQVLTGSGKTYRIMKSVLVSIEDTTREFIER